MDFKDIIEYCYLRKGPLIGGLIGLILAVSILIFGFFKVLFIAIFVFLGYYIGKKATEDSGFFYDVFIAIRERLALLFKKR